MKVWKDVFSGDEMVSDSYKMEMIFQDACLEVQAKFVTKGNDNVQIACDDEQEDEGEGETVINIVDAHRLNELQLSKKDCMTMLKAYLKKVVGYLKENGKEDRVAGFKGGATEMIKFIMEKFDEMQIFVGESMDTEAGMAFSYTKDGETDPVFLYMVDGCKEEKF
jgi:hypothetical protein